MWSLAELYMYFFPKCLRTLQHYIFTYLVKIDASQRQLRQWYLRFRTSFHIPGSSVLKLNGHKVRGTCTHLLYIDTNSLFNMFKHIHVTCTHAYTQYCSKLSHILCTSDFTASDHADIWFHKMCRHC